jgi:hypothetical protein
MAFLTARDIAERLDRLRSDIAWISWQVGGILGIEPK